MSPLGGCVADFLAKRPGPVAGATEQEAYEAAYELWPSKNRFTIEDFIGSLERVGYKPVERVAHGQGVSYFVLCLPEGN